MVQTLRTHSAFAEDPGWFTSTHIAPHNHLGLQSQGVWFLLVDSVGTLCKWWIYYMSKIRTHKIFLKRIIMNFQSQNTKWWASLHVSLHVCHHPLLSFARRSHCLTIPYLHFLVSVPLSAFMSYGCHCCLSLLLLYELGSLNMVISSSISGQYWNRFDISITAQNPTVCG